jgi:hypothetical protein
MKKLKALIKESIIKNGRPSSSRIFSYVMMSIILLLGLSHVTFEFGNAILTWNNGEAYVPSVNSISITAMWLAHQLTLLGLYKRSDILKKKIQSKEDSEIK